MDQLLKSKNAMYFILVLIVAAVFSSCLLNPQARTEMNKMDERVQNLVRESMNTATQIERIAEKIKEIQVLSDTGKISPEKMTELLTLAATEQGELLQHYENLKTEVTAINESQETLRNEYGVPWWQIALNGALGVVSVLAGGGAIKMSGTAARLTSMGKVFVQSIEMGKTPKEIKDNVKYSENPEAEKIYKEMYGHVIKKPECTG